MTQIEAKLLDELEALENARKRELEMLQKELLTIQQQQQQIIKLLQKPEENADLSEVLAQALAPLFANLQISLAQELEKLSKS